VLQQISQSLTGPISAKTELVKEQFLSIVVSRSTDQTEACEIALLKRSITEDHIQDIVWQAIEIGRLLPFQAILIFRHQNEAFLCNHDFWMEVDVDVLISGAGPSGLALAAFLVHRGIKVLVVSKQSSPSINHRAHMINAASLECFRDIGLESTITKAAYSRDYLRNIRFCREFLGEEYYLMPKDRALRMQEPTKLLRRARTSI